MAYSICQIRIWIRAGFNETVHSVRESESGFANPAKPEVLSSRMTSHQYHQRKQATLTSHWATPTNPETTRFASESESGFIMNLNLDSVTSNAASETAVPRPEFWSWSRYDQCLLSRSPQLNRSFSTATGFRDGSEPLRRIGVATEISHFLTATPPNSSKIFSACCLWPLFGQRWTWVHFLHPTQPNPRC